MLSGRRARTLSAMLAIRMIVVSASVFAVLFVAFFARYIADTPLLRQATLQADTQEVLRAIRQGRDPSDLEPYRNYPDDYAFRVFDHRLAANRKVLAEANSGLLPMGGPPGFGSGDLEEGFSHMHRRGDPPGLDLWLLVDRDTDARGTFWIQAAMLGDPAWRWRGVMATEMLDHVLMPALTGVPALTLAMFLATRHALQPLQRIARRAAELDAAATAGTQLKPLPEEDLPLEFRRVVVALNTMLAKLQRTLQRQAQFASDAAHELRTPLSVLTLEISQLPRDPATSRIAEELQSLSTLVNQLLRFAQAEDAMAGERHPVDIAAAARHVCEDLATVALARRQVIEFDAPEQPVVVSGHPALVDAAIRNIVENAIRHAPRESVISVTVDAAKRVLVDDRGPGVPDSQKQAVFERYWRADRRRMEGAGIGLALVRRIAQLHGGDVRVEDRSDGGARFVLALIREPAA